MLRDAINSLLTSFLCVDEIEVKIKVVKPEEEKQENLGDNVLLKTMQINEMNIKRRSKKIKVSDL